MRIFHRRRPGQALVEFAMVMPLFLTLSMGIADAGFLYHHQLLLTDAAREGARLGSLGETAASIRSVVRSRLASQGYSPVPADSAVIVDMSGDHARVEIRSQVPFLFAFSGPAIPLKASTEMRRE